MKIQKNIVLLLLMLCIVLTTQAQKDTINQSSIKQLDKEFLQHPFALKMKQIKTVINNSWDKAFILFKDNDVYLLGGLNLSKQNIKASNYNSNFIYNLNDYNKDVFKPGYFSGVRIDGKYNGKHLYSFAASLNNMVTGTNYKQSKSESRLIGSYSNFKADDHFFTLSLSAHYKKLLSISDTSKFKFYLVGGPSIHTRLSGQSIDNLVTDAYHLFFLTADVGVEFDNQSFYTLFMHYHQGINSMTKSPIKTSLNSFEIGIMIKAKDLF